MEQGLIAGLTHAEAGVRYPEPPVRFPHTAVYGQESLIAFRARMETMLSRLLHEKETAAVAVVSHGKASSQLSNVFIGSPVNQTIPLVTGNTGIHRCAYRMASEP